MPYRTVHLSSSSDIIHLQGLSLSSHAGPVSREKNLPPHPQKIPRDDAKTSAQNVEDLIGLFLSTWHLVQTLQGKFHLTVEDLYFSTMEDHFSFSSKTKTPC